MKHTRNLAAILLLSCYTMPALSEAPPTNPSNSLERHTPSLLHGIKDRLPSITLVKQPYGRSVVVLKVNCPVEVLTGVAFPPLELARQALDQTAMQLNEKEFFKYDIQFVCG